MGWILFHIAMGDVLRTGPHQAIHVQLHSRDNFIGADTIRVG